MTEPAKISVVGAGLVGVRHIQAIGQASNAEIAAIVDNCEEARQFADKNALRFYSSLEAMFNDVKPDGVVLSTPTPLHVEQGLACVEAGCPVLIEKPIAVSATDALALVRHGEARGVPILVGHHRRHNPLIQKARALIDAGEIGEPRSAQGTCWLYKPDDYYDIAQWRKQKGAGPISVNLVHDVDLMRYLLGDVIRVQAAATKSIRGYENEDVAAAVLTFSNGVVGTIAVSDSIVAPWSWELTANENPAYPVTDQSCLTVGGSRGSLSIPDLTLWTHQGRRSWWHPISATSYPQVAADPLVNQIEHFSLVIAGAEAPLVSGLEGVKTLQVVEAIQNSAELQTAIDIEVVD